jgi:Exo-beta-D-glucosaminidase Ig-fold domain
VVFTAETLSFERVALVELELSDAAGRVLSRNVYWRAGRESDYRALSAMSEQPLAISYTHHVEEGETTYDVTLSNTGKQPALEVKLTLLDSHTRQRLLPAYYSDNYISLLPGESVHISVSAPQAAGQDGLFTVRGWNVSEHSVTATEGQ